MIDCFKYCISWLPLSFLFVIFWVNIHALSLSQFFISPVFLYFCNLNIYFIHNKSFSVAVLLLWVVLICRAHLNVLERHSILTPLNTAHPLYTHLNDRHLADTLHTNLICTCMHMYKNSCLKHILHIYFKHTM